MLALAAEPQDRKVRYFSNNNLGYSLVQLGRFDEAEEYCEAAIGIDKDRHNAHKNLGLVYQGQGRWLDAAFCFVCATWLAPGDQRALMHLRQLLKMRPQLTAQSGDLEKEIERLGHLFDECQGGQIH